MDKQLGKTTNLCNLFTMESKLESFEMWAYRRMLRVSWTEHKTDEEVLRMVNTARKKMPVFWTRKSEVDPKIVTVR